MMIRQSSDQILCFRTIGIHMFKSVVAHTRAALIRLFARIELRVHKKTVLQVIDAQLRRFLIGHRAQVPGDLDPTFMSCLNRGLQFRSGDVHVRLK